VEEKKEKPMTKIASVSAQAYDGEYFDPLFTYAGLPIFDILKPLMKNQRLPFKNCSLP
jgi:hypothetical protein